MVGEGCCLRIDTSSRRKRQDGDEGCKAKTAASDGKDAGWGESGIREEDSESSLEHPWDAPTL